MCHILLRSSAQHRPCITARLLALALNQSLHVRDALVQNLRQHLRVFELLGHLADDAFCEFPLLALLDLALVADPALEHGLGFSSQGGALFELEGLGFEAGGFLDHIASVFAFACIIPVEE